MHHSSFVVSRVFNIAYYPPIVAPRAFSIPASLTGRTHRI
jgi:hypothetical protein